MNGVEPVRESIRLALSGKVDAAVANNEVFKNVGA